MVLPAYIKLRVLVCGGRTYDDQQKVDQTLSRLHRRSRIDLIIHGAQKGADTLASEWAKRNGVPELPFPVSDEEWKRIGKSAGPARNQRMLDIGRPNLCVSFPGGRGTADMVARASLVGLPTMQIR